MAIEEKQMETIVKEIPKKEINKILDVYNTLGKFLDKFLDRKVIYQRKFLNDLDKSLREIEQKKTKEVKSYADFIS